MIRLGEREVIFNQERPADLFEEIKPLIAKHYAEIPVDMGQPLEPDWKEYENQDSVGWLRAYTARDESCRLIGYAIFFLRPHQHSKNSVQAFADLLYIEPGSRGFGHAFVKWCDEKLRSDGAKVVYHSVTPHFDFSAILTRMGYEPVGTTYARRL